MKVAVVIFVIVLGWGYINRDNWTENPRRQAAHDRRPRRLYRAKSQDQGAAPARAVTVRTTGEGLVEDHPEVAKDLSTEQVAEVEGIARRSQEVGIAPTLGLKEMLTPFDDSVRGPFCPYGLTGLMAGAALVFFAYIGFDSISTHSEEAIRPKHDVPFGILASLILCTVLYILMTAVITGMEPYYQIDTGAPVAAAFRHKAEAANSPMLRSGLADFRRRACGNDERAARDLFEPGSRLSGDGPRRPVAAWHLRRRARKVSYAAPLDHLDRRAGRAGGRVLPGQNARRDGQHRDSLGLCVRLRVGDDPSRQPTQRRAAIPLSGAFVVAPLGILVNLAMMMFLPLDTWIRLVVWLFAGLVIYFAYGMWHSTMSHDIEREMKLHGATGSNDPLE